MTETYVLFNLAAGAGSGEAYHYVGDGLFSVENMCMVGGTSYPQMGDMGFFIRRGDGTEDYMIFESGYTKNYGNLQLSSPRVVKGPGFFYGRIYRLDAANTGSMRLYYRRIG